MDLASIPVYFGCIQKTQCLSVISLSLLQTKKTQTGALGEEDPMTGGEIVNNDRSIVRVDDQQGRRVNDRRRRVNNQWRRIRVDDQWRIRVFNWRRRIFDDWRKNIYLMTGGQENLMTGGEENLITGGEEESMTRGGEELKTERGEE